MSRSQTPPKDSLPFNRFQWLATHNSYHIAPPQPLRDLINTFSPGDIARGNRSRFEKAVQSGAQWISTDAPEIYSRDLFSEF